MKRILFSIILLATATGCLRDELEGGAPGKGRGIGLTAGFNVPEVKPASRAGIADGMIDQMWVMVFNENGNYLSRHRGTADGTANYTFGEIQVTTQARTLHFVANYDWTGFLDSEQIGRSESEVVALMNVSGGNVAYWQRVVRPQGFDAPDGTVINLTPGTETISLLRNVAQVTVANLTDEGGNGMSLTGVTFAVGNYFDKGSVAPFDRSTGTFGTGTGDDFVAEAFGGVPVAATEGDFVNAQNGSAGPSSQAKEIYERRNSTSREQTYLIVKGYFQDGGGVNTSVPSYYKIDICDADATVLLDLQRNFKYRIGLDLVSHSGYPTLGEAVLNAASNNINASVVVSEYTAISDGKDVLYIENSSFTYVRPDEQFSIAYAYIDGASGDIDNSGISIALQQDGAKPVVNGAVSSTYLPDPGAYRGWATITGRTAMSLPAGDIHRATITISKGSLSRTIQLQLRPAMNFDIETDPENGIVVGGVGTPTGIVFKMPADISPRLFPMPVYIDTKKFSPDPAYRGELSIEFAGGQFRYVYNAPYLGLDAGGEPIAHTVHLVSNSADTEEQVKLSAAIFNDGFAQFHTAFQFIDAAFDPATPARTAGAQADIRFRIPADYDWAANGDGCVVTIYTDDLEPRTGSGFETPASVSDEYGTGYRYTVSGPVAANQDITAHLQTLNATANVLRATIRAPKFNPAEISVRRGAYWNFVDPRFTVNGNNGNSQKPRASARNTDLRLCFALPQDFPAEDLPVTVTLGAANLSLRTGTSNGITVTGPQDNVFTIVVDTLDEVYFTVRTSTNRPTGVMTLASEFFNQSANLNSAN